MTTKNSRAIPNQFVEDTITDIFGYDLHLKRIRSISDATLGVMHSLSLAIHIIGQGLSQAKDLQRKHCVKQVDRMLSNPGIQPWDLFDSWVKYVISERTDIMVAMDWTEFDHDGHSTIVLSLVSGHGRATPLIWKSVDKENLKGRRNTYEDEVLVKLRECLPDGIRVTIIADRGFGDTKLFDALTNALKFEYIIRLKENLWVTDSNGEQKQARDWLIKGGRTKKLPHALLTDKDYEVGSFICTQKKGMKEAWFLAVSSAELTGTQAISWYAKRWGIETSFRDIKDYKFGMGMKHMRTASPERRDKLFLISALSIALLTLLGAAGDAIGLEKYFKVNTSKTRSYSFWRQGCMYYELVGSIKKPAFDKLMRKFYELLAEHRVFRECLGVL